MALANLVGVQRAAASAYKRTNPCAFLATGQTTDCRAAYRTTGDRQFVTVLLPERSMATMIANTRRRRRFRKRGRRQHELKCPKNQQTQ